MPLLTAPAIYSPTGWLHDHVLALTPDGEIEALRPRHAADQPRPYPGVLIPGWVNAHGHLELSALAGDIPEGTGMTGFIGKLFQARAAYEVDALQTQARQALYDLHQGGTMALGDISNLPITAAVKQGLPEVFTHTFVEALGLAAAEAPARLAQAQATAAAFAAAGLAHSLTPHAPYSVSSELLRMLYVANPGPLSLHLLESQEEVELFATGAGAFARFYAQLGLPYQPFAAKDAVSHVTEALPHQADMLFVHNVELSHPDFVALATGWPRAWFVLCPRANWYIHRRLPMVPALAAHSDRFCLGTDSLASNHSLDLAEEVAFLLTAFPQLDLHRVIRWATTHGAAALGVADRLGQFRLGTRPGVLHWHQQQAERLY
jgi:cytosine/adenosine deaminase-related metal-dependent hydrolase